jgi:hypothetical protein
VTWCWPPCKCGAYKENVMSMDGRLNQLFQKHLRDVHWCRVETGSTGRGVPDLNGCYQGTEFWLELKQTHGWAVSMRPEQVAWCLQRLRAGGRVAIAVRRTLQAGPRRGPAVDELWLACGHAGPHLALGGLRGTPLPMLLGCWPGGPAKWPWRAALGLLTTPCNH